MQKSLQRASARKARHGPEDDPLMPPPVLDLRPSAPSPVITPEDAEEVVYQVVHRVRASIFEVRLPDRTVTEVAVDPGYDNLQDRNLRRIMETLLDNFDDNYHMLFLDGNKVGADDVIIVEPDDSGEAVSTIRVLMPGLRGGAPEDPRSIIANILMAKGLSAQEARDKGDEVLARVPKDSVLAWLPKANWQTLKALVTTRVTFVNKSRKEKDPLMDKDPWMEAIRSKSTSSASTDKAPIPSVNPEAHVQLIPQVWLNDDGSHPQILERVQHGNTGLALLSPQQFENWIDVQLPLSCDELAIVVWPPLPTPPENPSHTVVTFPAHIQASTTTTTLLVGQLFQMGSKEIRLKEDPNPTAFPTRDSVSLMVEIFQENTDEAPWQQCTSDPLGYIKAHVETCTEVQG